MSVLIQERICDGEVVLLTINRPESLNSLNTETGLKLNKAMAELSFDPSVRVVVITGAGKKSFSTGGDFKERNGMTDEEWKQQHRLFEDIARQFREFPKPLIAAVNGFALGGGCELALSCDFIIASENAQFGLPEVTRGIIPGIGGTQTIGRYVPKGVALELLMTGRHMGAEEASRRGIVNEVVEAQKLLSTVLETCQLISKNSPNAVRLVKKAYRLGIDSPIEMGVEIALECYNQTVIHPDRMEGSQAFIEKRSPHYMNS
ncbi:enoyl-CoA hydratase/isomerase family protein [Planococcus sp. X10-3]|uniref:enoyl-CoA hydratase/isomerase family protein n=1 Tax=Planococcus sp. X10-3 TaxID=3061240 RepID=UPI003BB1CF94